MFHLLSRSRRLAAMLTAGILGIAPVTAAPPKASVPVAHSPLPKSREQEMRIELAWMADSATFRCTLRARATEDGIELSGSVPRAEVRARAVKIAQDACGKKVTDRIAVSRHAHDPYTPASHQELLQGANRALSAALGPQKKGIMISIGESGEVVLETTSR